MTVRHLGPNRKNSLYTNNHDLKTALFDSLYTNRHHLVTRVFKKNLLNKSVDFLTGELFGAGTIQATIS